MTIVVITDCHFGKVPTSMRRSDIADSILRRVVDSINKDIKPDVTLLLGDLVDVDETSDRLYKILQLKKTIDLLKSPSIVIPGNHDGDIETFYSVFERPAEIIEIKGVRFLPFIDAERPEFNAERMPLDLKRMDIARRGFDGLIISLQHVPIFPSEESDCPCNYINANEIIQSMHRNKISLSVSGHHHPGIPPIQTAYTCFVTTPALCDYPFYFQEIILKDNIIKVINHKLKD